MKTPRLNGNHWLLTRPIAHRGLWGGDVVENSITAYQNAVNNGYPIEIDLYSTTDGVLVSFHDASLVRMTGADGLIYEKSFAELQTLFLNNSDQKIPTFDQVLEIVDGSVPLLIEIKNQPDENVVKRVLDRLKSYKGEFAIQSFSPFYINQVRILAPHILRGILATENAVGEKPLTKFVVKNMNFNFLCKPDFISYSYTGLPLKKRKVKNTPIITWTVTDQEIADKIKPYAKNIIFENFIPKE